MTSSQTSKTPRLPPLTDPVVPWHEEPTHHLLHTATSSSSTYRIFRAGLSPHCHTLMHSHHHPTLIIVLETARAYSETLEEVVDGDNGDDGKIVEVNGEAGVRKMRVIEGEINVVEGEVVKYEDLIHRVRSFGNVLDFVGVEVFRKGVGDRRLVDDRFRWGRVNVGRGNAVDVNCIGDRDVGRVAGLVVVSLEDGVLRIGGLKGVVRLVRGAWVALDESVERSFSIKNVGRRDWSGYYLYIVR